MSGWKLSALALLALGAADLVALNVYFPEVWAPGEVPVPDDSVQPVSPGPPREPVAEPEEPGPAVEPVADDKAEPKEPEPVLVADDTGKPEPAPETPEERVGDIVKEPPAEAPREDLVAKDDQEQPGDESPEAAGEREKTRCPELMDAPLVRGDSQHQRHLGPDADDRGGSRL